MKVVMAKSVPIQSIKRALDVLDLLVAADYSGDGVPLQAIAAHLEVAAPTAHNIVRTMVECGYVHRDAEHRYHLGPRCRDLSRGAQFSAGLLSIAQGILLALAENTGESVVLAALVHGRRCPLLRADGHQVIRVSAAIENIGTFFEQVTGRVLAAYADPAELEAIRAVHALPGAGWKDVDTEEKLAQRLTEIRRQGYTEDLTSDDDVYALAVPVLDRGGALLAALGMYLPAARADAAHRVVLLAAAREAAARITQQS